MPGGAEQRQQHVVDDGDDQIVVEGPVVEEVVVAQQRGPDLEAGGQRRSGLDLAAGTPAVRYVVLDNVLRFDLQYLDPALTWRSAWPTAPDNPPLPLAVRLQVEFGSGITVTRIFALHA